LVFGLFAGVGVLLRDGILIVTFAVLLAFVWRLRPLPAVLRSHVVPMVVGIALALTPWAARNYVAQGKFTPIRSGYGLNLWMGNHSQATGTDKTLDGRYQMNLLWQQHEAYYAQAMPADEAGRAAFMKREALDYIRSHPAHYLALTVQRLYYYLWFDPTHPLAANMVYRVSYVVLLLLALPGLVLLVWRRRLDPALVVMLLGFIALYVPVIVLPRYRIVPNVLLLLFASYFVSELWSRWRQRPAKTRRSLSATQV